MTQGNYSKIKALVRSRYKDLGGNPFDLTDGQAEIFECIAKRLYPRNHCMCYTQYGKSDTVAEAVLTRITTYPEKWAIVAPSNKKAKIIMGYLIGHTFDNEYTLAMFEPEKGESVERIRRERSKERMTFKHPNGMLGEVFTLSSEGKRTKDLLDALLGFGAPNIIIDESSLIDDVQYVGILRMLGGHKDNFLFEIGNPMRRNHFLKASRNPSYHKININVDQGVAEGRIDESFVSMMRGKPLFDQLYMNKFPDEDTQDRGGYSSLLAEDYLKSRMRLSVPMAGEPMLGCDVAGEGSNYSVIVKRSANAAQILYRAHNPDSMNFAGIIAQMAVEHGVPSRRIFVDKVGIGKGVYDRLREIGETKDVVGVSAGEPASLPDYMNKRAEMFWRLKEWLGKGELIGHDWFDLLDVKYKIQSDKRIKIKSKDEMIADGVQSPDVADALALTFYSDIEDIGVFRRQENKMRQMKQRSSQSSTK